VGIRGVFQSQLIAEVGVAEEASVLIQHADSHQTTHSRYTKPQ
jgi:hypothetical protein